MSDEAAGSPVVGESLLNIFAVHPELTDMGNCDRFTEIAGDDYRYCTPWKKWVHWNGKCWELDESDALLKRAMKFVRFCRTVNQVEGVDEDVAKWIKKTESTQKILAMITLAKAKMSIAPEVFDTDPWLFNCANGTIDLRTGEIRDHKREDFITKLSPVKYAPFSECPRWETFLDEIMMGRKEVVEFLQAFLGYCLTGNMSAQIFAIAWGTGFNGKSTFANVILHTMGTYASELPVGMIMEKKNEEERIEGMQRFQGLRLAMFSEGKQGQKLAEGRLKTLTGGDQINARFLYGESFDFHSTCKIMLRTNHKPRVQGSDHAIWRRVNLIPFEYLIPLDKKDGELEEKLKAESPGILDWLVQGCVAWQRNGIPESQCVMKATAEYRAAEDPMGDFIDEKCIIDELGRVPTKKLYQEYVAFCASENFKPTGKKTFNSTFEERGFKKRHTSEGDTWAGIAMKNEWPAPTEQKEELPF